LKLSSTISLWLLGRHNGRRTLRQEAGGQRDLRRYAEVA
jgi:hypothetical protein